MKGGMKYVPADVLAELERIKIEDNIGRDAEAFERMAKRSRSNRAITAMDFIGPLGSKKKGKKRSNDFFEGFF